MAFIALAIHHPRPEHIDDLLSHMERVVEAVGEPPGLIDFRCWRESDGTRLIGLSSWESEEAFTAAIPLITSLRHQRKDEWSVAEDELLTLTEP